MRFAALGVLALACAACSGGGSVSDPAAEADFAAPRLLAEASLGPVRATVRTSEVQPRFGGRIPLVVEIETGPGAELAPIDFGARAGHFRIRGRRPPETVGHLVRHRLSVEPERTGVNLGALPPIAFRITEGEGAGRRRELRLPGFELDVAGLLEDDRPDLASLREPLPPLSLPPRSRNPWSYGIAAAALLGAGALLVGWKALGRRRDGAAPPPIDPSEEARRELDNLLAAGLVLHGRFGEFYLRLTGIVRRFIERTTGVHAPNQTTEEFLREAAARQLFAPERERALTAFLEAADLVKFAGQVPGHAEVDGAVAAARSFCGIGPAGGAAP